MADFFDKEDIVSEGDFFDSEDIEQDQELFSLDEASKEGDPSQLEAVGRGAIQGATFGLADEIGAAALTPLEMARQQLSKLIPGSSENIDAQLREQGFTGLEESGIQDTYKELRDETRDSNKESEEAHKGTYIASDIAGGILPAVFTGGGTAAAKVAAEGTKQALKQAAKTGAKYGAVSGYGYGEGDTIGEDVMNTALGAGLGGVAGAALPVAVKGAKEGLGSLKRGTQGILKALPGAETAMASYKYGKQGKKVLQEVLDDDLKGISKQIIKNIETEKTANNLKRVKELLDDLGYKVDTRATINEAIDDIKKIVDTDYLDVQNKELLPKLMKMTGYDEQAAKMLEKNTKNVIKKAVESQNKVQQEVIKAEKKLAKLAEQSGDEIQTISDINKPMSDLDIPLDTQNGKIAGASGKMKNPEGEEYIAKVLGDATEYQPEVSKILGPDGRPIIKTIDKGTGKISAMVGNIEDKLKLNLKNMKISEVEALRKQLNLINKIAKAQGAVDDPILQRAQGLARDLKTLTDDVVKKSGNTDLIDKRARFSDVFSAEELLGIDKRFAARSDVNDLQKITALGDKIGFEKGFKGRQEVELAEKMLGDKIVPQKTKEQLDLLRKLNQVAGRGSFDDSVSRTGIFSKAVSNIPNLAGRAVKKVTDVTSKITSPVTDTIGSIAKMSQEQLGSLAQKFSASESNGQKFLGQQLSKALEQEGAAQSQAIWAISQSPAFRELLRREVPQLNKEASEDLEMIGNDIFVDEGSTVDSASAPVIEEELSEPSRKPASVSNIDEGLEHILEIEAGFQKQTSDKGNYLDGKLIGTNRGITPKAYKEFYGNTPSEDDIRNLTKEQALDIYKADYINKPGFDQISDVNLQTNLVDFGINSGPSQAIKTIQRLVGANVDGKMGPETLGKINNYDGNLNAELVQARREFIDKLSQNPEYSMYENGWNNRIDMIERVTADESEQSPKIDINSIIAGYADQELPEETSEEEIKDVENSIDRVNQQQSSGDGTPVNQLDELLGKIDKLKVSEEDKDEIESEAINMSGYSDGVRLKELLRKIAQLK